MPSATAPDVDERQALHRAAEHLESMLPASRAMRMPSPASACARSGSPSSSRQSEPSRTSSHARSADGGPLEQTPRALQPAVGHGVLAAKRPVVPREPDRDARGAARSPRSQIQAVGALARVEHHVGEIEPPGGQPEPFERLGRFAPASASVNASRASVHAPRASASWPARQSSARCSSWRGAVEPGQREDHRRERRVILPPLPAASSVITSCCTTAETGAGTLVLGQRFRGDALDPLRTASPGIPACSCRSGCARRGLRAPGSPRTRRAAPRAPARDPRRPCAPARTLR